jgi:hypothetical protein
MREDTPHHAKGSEQESCDGIEEVPVAGMYMEGEETEAACHEGSMICIPEGSHKVNRCLGMFSMVMVYGAGQPRALTPEQPAPRG